MEKATPSEVKLGIIGGDLRALTAARELAARGFETALYGIDTCAGECGNVTKCAELASAVRGASAVILPLPAMADDERIRCPLTKKTILLQQVLAQMQPHQLLLGGRVSPALRRQAQASSVRLFDYYEREELKIANAVPTAEGALSVAMSEVPHTINGARCLVIGYGRLGRVLTRLLAALGAKVCVSARRDEDLAWIRTIGCEGVHTEDLDAVLHRFDLIFNTVPAPVLDAHALRQIRPGVPVIELASAPGGIDLESAKALGTKTVFALSLPGKCAPVTAGRIIEESILHILAAEGVVQP